MIDVKMRKVSMRISLLDYYKYAIYDHGYFMCERDKKYNTDHRKVDDDIYFNDEMDYNICADYHCHYIGGVDDWTEDDIKLLNVLGFTPEDFESEE